MSSYTADWFRGHSQGAFSSAREVLPLAFKVLPHDLVVDVGCGLGMWLSAATRLGASRVVGIDGDYVDRSQLAIQDFRAADLTLPLDIEEKFDLALSLEVAEHLPAASAEQFVTTITSLAPTVIFSAAVPMQGGNHHINEQWPGYWSALFRKRGFHCYDSLRRAIWMNEAIEAWYRQNILVYSAVPIPAWETSRVDDPLPLVHPAYMRDAPPSFGFKTAVRSLPRLALTAIRGRITARARGWRKPAKPASNN